MSRHKAVHTGEKPYSYEIWNHLCRKISCLHIIQFILEKNNKEKPYSNGICGKSFSLEHNLSAYYVFHTGQKQHSCDIHGRLFARKDKLSAHFAIHTGEKSYSCEICGKSFVRKDLSEHYTIHTWEKQHSCEICGRAFARKSVRMKHRIVHMTQSKKKETWNIEVVEKKWLVYPQYRLSHIKRWGTRVRLKPACSAAEVG